MSIEDLRDRRNALLERARERGDALQRYLVAVNGFSLVAILSIASGLLKDNTDLPNTLFASAFLFVFSLCIAGMILWRNLQQGKRGLDKFDDIIDKVQQGAITLDKTDSILDKYRKPIAKPYAICTQYIQLIGYLIFVVGMIFVLITLYGAVKW